MSIRHSLLARGYFPKELPPAFSTEQFAKYATTKECRLLLWKYKPRDNCTECARFLIARAGLTERELRIPHPFSFAKLPDLLSHDLIEGIAWRTFSSTPTLRSADRRCTTKCLRHRGSAAALGLRHVY